MHRLIAIGAALCATVPAAAAPDRPDGRVDAALRQIDALLPSVERFTLPNGLRVVVHTDRKAPVVAVTVRYGVGAKHEPPERSGFAHLFEHLMFYGSEHAPGDFHARVRTMGGQGVNGHTGYDDTVFYQTVPTGALDRMLFLEADRMGHMAGVIDRAVLDANRAIVQNEKRQTENQPMGTANAHVVSRLFPAGHPYGHTVLGSMASLDAASVDDVKAWHRRYYTPNNAVLVLTGDVSAADARRLVTRHFGDLPRGPDIAPPDAPITTLAAPVAETLADQVSGVNVTRHWVVPGRDLPDGIALDVAAKALGTLSGSWLQEALIRREGLVSSLIVSSGASADVGTFVISYTVADGVDPARVATRLDALLADFLREGPTREDIRRVAMREIGWQTLSLEPVLGQGSTLSDDPVPGGDPERFRQRLRTMVTLDPQTVRDAARRWLTRPAYTLTVVPGERAAYEQPAARPVAPAAPATPTPPAPPAGGASQPLPPLPPLRPTPAMRFPAVERTRLSNGVQVVLARRPGVPITRIAVELDAGTGADPADRPGVQELLLALLPEGTARRDARAIAIAHEELGADWFFDVGSDRTGGTITVPSASLDAAADLFADLLIHPALAGDAVERQRALLAGRLRQQATNPDYLATRTLMPLLYGPDSPEARAAAITPASVAAITRDDLAAVHAAWFRPEKARLFVVSDLSLERVRAALERGFGAWRGRGAAGHKAFGPPAPAAPSVTVVDRPGSPQSVILAAIPTRLDPRADLLALDVANQALGGARGRINLDLRERNNWSYWATGHFQRSDRLVSYLVHAPVQTNRPPPPSRRLVECWRRSRESIR